MKEGDQISEFLFEQTNLFFLCGPLCCSACGELVEP
jgi:hypothetical protein